MSLDPIEVALRVAAALDAEGIDYLVGGSLASSFAGEPRSTLDVDLVVRLREDAIPALVDRLGSEFHADTLALARAVRQYSSANIFHADSAAKVDLFILGDHPFEQAQMQRRQRALVARNPDRHLYVYAPEDILLQKLRWFRLGNEISDRQWRDVLGILRVSGPDLRLDILREGAQAFGVADLLARAFADADLPDPNER